MKDLKELEQSFASLSKDFETIASEITKPAGGADYKGQPYIAANTPQYAPSDSGPHNPQNYDGKDSNLKYEEWSKGMMAMMANIHDRIDNIHQQIYAHRDTHNKKFSSHQIGHLPPIHSPEKMNKALKTLGLAGDYEAAKKNPVKTGSDMEMTQSLISNYASANR